MNNKKQNTGRHPYRKYILILWGLFAFAVVSASLLIFLISKDVFGELPNTEQLENPETPLATEIYSADGKVIGKFYNENRSFVSYDEISPELFNALISTEDIRFYQHSGIDWKGVFAIPFYLIRGENRGASTISQQLAKNLFPRKSFRTIPQKIIRKLKEWIIAIRLEKFYTKEEIIAMYFNTVEFGSNTYGIKSASLTYFNKEPLYLNVEESAVLVGVLKAITRYSPVLNPENSKKRRNVVMSQMKKYGFITEVQYDSLKILPIKLNYSVESHTQGIATYFREFLRSQLKRWADENGVNLYGDGLRIYTTIDSRMQRYAEQAVREHLSDLQATFFKHWKGVHNAPYGWQLGKKDVERLLRQAIRRTDRYRILKAADKTWDEIYANFQVPRKMRLFTYDGDKDTTLSPYDSIRYYKWFLNPGFMAVETYTGKIKAWVGGIDYRYFKYDHVNKRAKRQVGSTFKPFVYATAVLNGYSPCLKVPNMPVIFPDFNNWQPKNNDGKYGGMLSLEQGLAQSNNCVTAWIMKRVNPGPVIDLAGAMGVDTSNIDPYPAIALGTPDISVFEMVGAFNTFGSKGIWTEPTFITRIEDKNGNVLQEFVPRKVEVIDEAYNYVILKMLMNTTRIRGGTAVRLRFRYNFTNEIAAKTGTTQNNSDGWFIGMIPQLTAGCWVGAEDRSVHFRSTYLGQGANEALPIWALFMQKVYADESLGITTDPFPVPEEELPVEIDCTKYQQDNLNNE